MTSSDAEFTLTDLADGTLAGPEWEGWLAAHPDLAAAVLFHISGVSDSVATSGYFYRIIDIEDFINLKLI